MMRSQEDRQSRLGTAFHTKNIVTCHILSRLCLNVTPVLITSLTKLFCSGFSATVPSMQENNLKGLLWIFTKQPGEAGGLVGQRRAAGEGVETCVLSCF
jgi:hypothetical protein